MEKRCCRCRNTLYDDEFVYHADYRWMCRDCFENYLGAEMDLEDIADALGIERINVTELTGEELEAVLEEEK